MTPTIEKIKAAARLVPDSVNVYQMDPVVWRDGSRATHPWQPWSDTEAGRSDALVLLAAVMKLSADGDVSARQLGAAVVDAFITALASGNVQQIQDATFAAAVAIGEYEEGKSDGTNIRD